MSVPLLGRPWPFGHPSNICIPIPYFLKVFNRSFTVANFALLCRVSLVIQSVYLTLYTNLSALFCMTWSLCSSVFDVVAVMIEGYSNKGRMSDLNKESLIREGACLKQ